jgi:putative membrane protein insertion efficiency factor
VTSVTSPSPIVHRLGKTQAAMLRAIAWYQDQRQGALSPCRFFPSCSEYASDAISLHGAWRGGLLAARRLSRCRPFGASGYDPVPDAPRRDGLDACCAHHEEEPRV